MTIRNLADQHCMPCDDTTEVIDRNTAMSYLQQLPEWGLSDDGKMISRRFEFKGFLSTISFINAMAWLVNREDHHPDFRAGYNYCEVGFMTHAIGGLSENDFICAAKVSALVN